MAGWQTFLVLALVTWLMRIAFVAVVPPDRLPPLALRCLQHLTPAILAALVVLGLLDAVSAPSDGAGGPVLVAVVSMSVLVTAWWSRSLVWTATLALVGVVILDVLLV